MRFVSGLLLGILLEWQAGLLIGPHNPRLIGYGCEGTQGVLYADEEDEFPTCKRIERRS